MKKILLLIISCYFCNSAAYG